MMFSKYVASILFFSLFMGLTGISNAAAPNCASLNFSQAKETRHYRELAKDHESFETQYRSFSEIGNRKNIFYFRIKEAFKKHKMSYSLKEHKKLFSFSEKQNERFLQVHSSESTTNFLYLAFESSRLKLLNDSGPGKEMATALNFFNKALMLTRIIESASKSDVQLLLEMKRQWILNNKIETNYLEQNDYKTMRLSLDLEPLSITKNRLYNILDRAYAVQKKEFEHILKNHYPELQANLSKSLPPSIGINRLFHGILTDKLWEMQRGLSEVRNMKDPYKLATFKNYNPAISLALERTALFYRLHVPAMKAIAKNQKLVEVASSGDLYPSPMFFKLMKFIAKTPRKRDNPSKDDLAYFKTIKDVLLEKFKVKIDIKQAEVLRDYYQTVEAIIPKMIFTRTEPLLQTVGKETFIISADMINGSGQEMSLVSKYTILAKNASRLQQIRASEKGVEETTLKFNSWSKKLTLIIRAAFQGIEVTDMRTGDDANFLLGRRPTKSELKDLSKLLQDHPEILMNSRLTYGKYQPKERIQEEIEKLESVEKAIDLDFYHFKLYEIPELPKFSVLRQEDNSIKLLLLEPASKDQLFYLEGIVNDIQPQFSQKIIIEDN